MPGKKWAHREKESLIRQVKQGKRWPQIRISGRSPAAVNQQRQRLRNVGLLGEVPKRRLRMWTTKEIRSAKEGTEQIRVILYFKRSATTSNGSVCRTARPKFPGTLNTPTTPRSA